MDLIDCVLLIFAMLNIITINVQGLRNNQQRKGVFQSLKNAQFDIIALQETHCDALVKQEWQNEWGGKSVWTTFKNDAAGVAFLFNQNLNIHVSHEKADASGRILSVVAEIDNRKCQLVNIYGPNPSNLQESEYFFNSIDNIIDPEIQPMFFGDFNMVEDIFVDRKGGKPKPRHTYGFKALSDLKQGHDLIDIWRNQNPNKKQFTWHSKDQTIHSRLDRIYIPKQYIPLVSNAFIHHFVWSDHDVCGISITLPSYKKEAKDTGN